MFPASAPRVPPSETHGGGDRVLRRASHGADRGTGITEYAAAIVLAAAVLASLTMVIPPRMGDSVGDALCRLLSVFSESADCGQAGDKPADYSPDYCVRNAESQHIGGTLDIAFVTIGKDYKFAKETLSDGSIVAIFSPKSEAGLVAGIGVDIGKENTAAVEARIDATVKGSYTPGEAYLFKNEEEYQEFEEQLKLSILDDTAQDLSPAYRFGRWLGEKTDLYDPVDMKEPEIKSYEVGLTEQIDASAGVWLGKPTSHGRHAADRGEVYDKWKLNLGVNGNVTVNPAVNLAIWKNEEGNDRTATTFSWSGTGGLGAVAGPLEAGGNLGWRGSTRIMRNEDGSLDYLRYTTTASMSGNLGVGGEIGTGKEDNVEKGGSGRTKDGRGQAVTQSVQINFDTPEEQAAGEALLRSRGLLPPANTLGSMINPLMDDQEGGTINQKPPADAPPWEHVFYEKGKVWQYAEDIYSDENSIGAKAKFGLALGAEINWGLEERYTDDAQILGPPDSEGNRNFIDYPDCVYEGNQGGR